MDYAGDAAGALYAQTDRWSGENSAYVGSYVAVGSFEPDIEIWNLDVIDPLEPTLILKGSKASSLSSSSSSSGGMSTKQSKKKNKGGKNGSDTNLGSTAISGLSNDTEYFVSALGLAAGTFRLATTAAAAAGRTALAGVAISGTGGQFTCTATTLAVGDHIVIGGTVTGTGSITSHTAGKIYEVSAITGTSPAVTGFTVTQEDGTAVVSTAGNGTGLTLTPYTIVMISGTGNNAQYFEIQAAADQATATAALGAGAGGTTLTHAGWVRRTVGTGGRAGRVQYETLVAMGSITGDQSDDIAYRDS
jgi:hypothetical protein